MAIQIVSTYTIMFIAIPIEVNFGDIKVLWDITESVLINLSHLCAWPPMFFSSCMYMNNHVAHFS